MQPKQIKIGPLTTSKIELNDLLKAWIAISLAFAIAINGLSFSFKFLAAFLISGVTVGIGFLFHELGHKVMAQKYGCFAEFRAFNQMLVLAVLFSFFGFIFAAPGAVMISGPVGVRRNGKISALGPLINLALATIFLLIYFAYPANITKLISTYGFSINAWLALFNMLPFWNFDGKKILAWNKFIYGLMVAIAVIFLFLQGFLGMGI